MDIYALFLKRRNDHAGRPTAKLDREILAILRISIFQLLHLDRVPAAAVVDDAVELSRRAGKKSASGFVNALLRRVSRERKTLPLPSEPPLDHVSITLSHPRWLAERWIARHGVDAATAWARFNNDAAPLTLRVPMPNSEPKNVGWFTAIETEYSSPFGVVVTPVV